MLASPCRRETALIARRILRIVRNGQFEHLDTELSPLSGASRRNPHRCALEEERQELLHAVAEKICRESPSARAPAAGVCVQLLRHLAAG